jgi:PAS domain S-box-containing protein
MSSSAASSAYPFLDGGGQLAEIIAAFDWGATSLGAIDSWPQSLRTTVALILRSPIPIVTLWGEDGIMIYNDAYSEFAGGRHPQLLGSKVREGWPEVADFNDHVMRTGLAGGTLAYRDQELTLYRSGAPEQVWMNLDYSPLLDEAGKPAGVIAIVVETTAKVIAENQVRSSEATFRTLAQSIPNQVWASSADGNVNWYNDRVYEYAGVEPGQLDDTGWASILHPEDVVPASQAWIAAVASGQIYETEFRIRRADGAYRWHIVRALPIVDHNGVRLRWVGTNTDIEDQKSAANILLHMNEILEREVQQRTAERDRTTLALQQAQKMEAIGKLTGGVAHDFNNLLQVISGNMQLLRREVAGNPHAERRLDNALAGVRRGAKLASYLLAFGRRQALDPRVVRIGRFIAGMEDMLRRSLGEEVEIETRIAPDLWHTLVDTAQVENAVLNLCINAHDAMKGAGQLVIEVSNTELADGCAGACEAVAGQYVMIAVSDTGCGMTAEVREQAFDPFFSTKPEGKGSGLGLSMVYGFVKQSGGHVKIESEVGEGTTVRIYLPRSLAPEDSAGVPVQDAVVGGPETILVVEDDDGVRATVVDLLSELGYRVLKACDASAALAIVESGVPIDLLFTDVIMPGPLRSPELARRARERLPDIAVLYTSGYTEDVIMHGGRLDADVDLLGKPYTREALARKVRHVLNNQRQRVQLRNGAALPAPGDASVADLVPAAPQVPAATAPHADAANAGINILLVEDDEELRGVTAELLELLGHSVVQAGDADGALRLLDGADVDVLMTDISLPGVSGEALAQRARAIRPGLRVIYAAGQQPHGSLDNCAVLLKPFSVEKLMGALNNTLQ